MDDRPLVLRYTRGLDVGVNELLHRFSLNRSTRRLLANDMALQDLYEKYLGGANVFEYIKGHAYKQEDLVWVRRSFGDRKLFLVRCVVDRNTSDLQAIVDQAYRPGEDRQPDPEFDRNGWKDENRDVEVSDYGIDSMLRRYFVRRLEEHEGEELYHKFGMLRVAEGDAEKKLMLADLSNADGSRGTMFYPYYTRRIDPDGTVLYGFYRAWDCGTLEIDLVFRLGHAGRVQRDGFTSDVVACNDYVAGEAEYADASVYKYFSSARDKNIFAPLSCGQSEIDDTVQLNRNDYVNTYSARIKFPQFRLGSKAIQFQNDYYMIFGSDVMSQDADKGEGQVEPGANCMAFCDKNRNGFTALYVTYPDDGHLGEAAYNAENGGLVGNSFHCHIVGRWEEQPIQI